jgi:predicted DCC family thiol-disulfide oxidoreductase YuxK
MTGLSTSGSSDFRATGAASSQALLTVYYDGACRLCSAEIRQIAALDRAGDLFFVDCAAAGFDTQSARPELAGRSLHNEGITQEALLSSMHVHDVLGGWHRGVDAIALLYGSVGALGLARLWAHPWSKPVMRRVYPWVVRNRMTLSALGLHRVLPRVVRLFAPRPQAQPWPHCEADCHIGGATRT